MPQENEQEQLAKLLALIEEAIQRDEQLRQTYQIGERFRFVRDRLHALLESIKKETIEQEKKIRAVRAIVPEEDEMLVYIHLYNAQGVTVRTWQSVITPKAFFDFSVNRPIYREKAHIEAFIHSKANKVQHAYLTIVMKKERVLPSPEEGLKDSLGNPLIKVKEGSLHHDRLVAFSHNGQMYELSEGGELILKG